MPPALKLNRETLRILNHPKDLEAAGYAITLAPTIIAAQCVPFTSLPHTEGPDCSICGTLAFSCQGSLAYTRQVTKY
jgi:hypothetical protein